MLRSIAASCLLAFTPLTESAHAQSSVGEGCPDQVIDHLPTAVDVGGVAPCGGTVLQLPGGLELRQRPLGCPLTITVTPARDTTKHQPGSGTYTMPGELAEVRTHHYRCQDDTWLFGAFGSIACKHVRSQTVGLIQNYRQLPCAPQLAQPSVAGGA